LNFKKFSIGNFRLPEKSLHKDFGLGHFESVFKEGKHKLNGISEKVKNL
jgi:hypothetical protein